MTAKATAKNVVDESPTASSNTILAMVGAQLWSVQHELNTKTDDSLIVDYFVFGRLVYAFI